MLTPASRCVLTAVVALATAGLAACGGDDAEPSPAPAEAPAKLAITMTGSPKAPVFAVAGETPAGVTEITLTNEGKGEADGQLARVEGDHSVAEVLGQLRKAQSGKAIEDWFRAVGGPGTTPPGESATVTQVLEPGTYYVLGGTGPPKGDPAGFEVTGTASDAELPADGGTLTAKDYSFSGSLKAGPATVAFVNAGNQWHHFIGFRLNPGQDVADVKRFFASDGKGKPPFSEHGGFDTAVLDPGVSQSVATDLEAGRYALVCFLPDRTGGPPHFTRGMVSALTVE